MINTLTKPRTRKSSIVNDLSYRRVSDRVYEVESRSVTLGSHIVRKTHTGDWVCSRQCTAFNVNYQCSHVATVLRAERTFAEARAFTVESECCGCMGPAGDMDGCDCICHGPSLPLLTTSGVEVASLPFQLPGASVVVKSKMSLEDIFEY